MKKFILKILMFVVLLVGVGTVIIVLDQNVVKNQYEGEYTASLVDKVARAKSIHEPKILLIGNSSLCFGMDSQKLEESVGMPVVDMGLHGGLSNAFHEEMAKLLATQGDIVILCHSNYSDDDQLTGVDLAWTTIEKHRELWPLIREKDWPQMLKAYPKYAINSFGRWITGTGNRIPDCTCYARTAFNEYGDIVFRPPNDRFSFKEESISLPAISDACIDRINFLNTELHKRGATLLVAGWPIASGEFTPPEEEFERFESELRERLDCPVISHVKDYFMPYELFYNTVLHLTWEGAQIRTEQLIKDFLAWKAEQG